jgi:hypothetical protein
LQCRTLSCAQQASCWLHSELQITKPSPTTNQSKMTPQCPDACHCGMVSCLTQAPKQEVVGASQLPTFCLCKILSPNYVPARLMAWHYQVLQGRSWLYMAPSGRQSSQKHSPNDTGGGGCTSWGCPAVGW